MKNKLWYRKTLLYKIKMWFYHLTFRDIKNFIQNGIYFILEIIMVVLGFIIIFILPAFFY